MYNLSLLHQKYGNKSYCEGFNVSFWLSIWLRIKYWNCPKEFDLIFIGYQIIARPKKPVNTWYFHSLKNIPTLEKISTIPLSFHENLEVETLINALKIRKKNLVKEITYMNFDPIIMNYENIHCGVRTKPWTLRASAWKGYAGQSPNSAID